MPLETEKILKQQCELASSVGAFLKYWGFKSIHGRIWTLLYLSKVPRDAQYFIEHLEVSKALVSLAIKDLLQYKVICRVEQDPQGAFQFYSANPKVMEVILNVLKERELMMLSKAQKAADALKACSDKKLKELDICEDRVRKMSEMTYLACYSLENLIHDESLNIEDMSAFKP